ncbi:hypothetical protein [Flavobacterium sp.]|uniref:hypothetical protein n=1 Tax=Flavobacterium sp. TaxID=239 RepID=UPI0039E54B7F
MKKFFALVAFFGIGHFVSAQNLYLGISGENERETAVIDSIGYNKQHENAKSITDETQSLAQKLSRLGYIESRIEGREKTNDSTFAFLFRLGPKTNSIRISIGRSPDLKELVGDTKDKDTLIMPYPEVESFMNGTLAKLEKKGFALAKLQLVDIKNSGNHLEARLHLTLNKQRHLNDIVINGYDKFPEGHKKQIKRMYRNKTFNQENLKKVHDDFEKFRFVKQTKYPEILFRAGFDQDLCLPRKSKSQYL